MLPILGADVCRMPTGAVMFYIISLFYNENFVVRSDHRIFWLFLRQLAPQSFPPCVPLSVCVLPLFPFNTPQPDLSIMLWFPQIKPVNTEWDHCITHHPSQLNSPCSLPCVFYVSIRSALQLLCAWLVLCLTSSLPPCYFCYRAFAYLAPSAVKLKNICFVVMSLI